mgnify:CR=1 FL=1
MSAHDTHRVITSPMASAIDGETQTITIGLIPHVGVPLALCQPSSEASRPPA